MVCFFSLPCYKNNFKPCPGGEAQKGRGAPPAKGGRKAAPGGASSDEDGSSELFLKVGDGPKPLGPSTSPRTQGRPFSGGFSGGYVEEESRKQLVEDL